MSAHVQSSDVLGEKGTYFLGNGLFAVGGQFELHAPQLTLNVRGCLTDLVPGLPLAYSLLRLVVESHHVLHHPEGLPQWAVLVIITVTILLKEVLLEQSCHVESDLVRVTECRLSNELNNLVELLGSGEQLLDAVTEAGELGVVLLVVLVERCGVLAVR